MSGNDQQPGFTNADEWLAAIEKADADALRSTLDGFLRSPEFKAEIREVLAEPLESVVRSVLKDPTVVDGLRKQVLDTLTGDVLKGEFAASLRRTVTELVERSVSAALADQKVSFNEDQIRVLQKAAADAVKSGFVHGRSVIDDAREAVKELERAVASASKTYDAAARRLASSSDTPDRPLLAPQAAVPQSPRGPQRPAEVTSHPRVSDDIAHGAPPLSQEAASAPSPKEPRQQKPSPPAAAAPDGDTGAPQEGRFRRAVAWVNSLLEQPLQFLVAAVFIVFVIGWLWFWLVRGSPRFDAQLPEQAVTPTSAPAGAPAPRRIEPEAPVVSGRTPWQSYTAALDATGMGYEDPPCTDILARVTDRSFEAIRRALGRCNALQVPPPLSRSAIVLLVQQELQRSTSCKTSTIVPDGVYGGRTDAQFKVYLACAFKLDSTELVLADYVALGMYLNARTN